MKRLLLATALGILAAAPALAEEIKVNDGVRFSEPAIACRSFEKLGLIEQWTSSTSIGRVGAGFRTDHFPVGKDRVVSRRAAEQIAAMHGCEIRDGGSSLFVMKVDPYNPRSPSWPTVKLCVHSMFITRTPDPDACTWILVGKHDLAKDGS